MDSQIIGIVNKLQVSYPIIIYPPLIYTTGRFHKRRYPKSNRFTTNYSYWITI